MVLRSPETTATQAVMAVSMALRAQDEDIPHNLAQAAAELFNYVTNEKTGDWPDWVRQDYEPPE
jgi:hypothetical protein